MVLGHTEQQKQLCPVPVRRAEFPECTADCINAGGSHVDGTEPAMGGIIRRAEILCPETGQGLRLVAPGKEGQFLRIFTQRTQPFGGLVESFLPGNFLEFIGAARAGAQQGLFQPGRRHVLHDSGSALGAQHAPVDRMIAVAFNVTHLAIAQMHIDAAAAGTHVAGGLPHFLVHGRRCGDGPVPDAAGQMLWCGLAHAHKNSSSLPKCYLHRVGISNI